MLPCDLRDAMNLPMYLLELICPRTFEEHVRRSGSEVCNELKIHWGPTPTPPGLIIIATMVQCMWTQQGPHTCIPNPILQWWRTLAQIWEHSMGESLRKKEAMRTAYISRAILGKREWAMYFFRQSTSHGVIALKLEMEKPLCGELLKVVRSSFKTLHWEFARRIIWALNELIHDKSQWPFVHYPNPRLL